MRDPGKRSVNARLANTTGSVAQEHATPAKNTQRCLSESLAAKCIMIVRAAQAHHANSVPLSPMPLVSNLSFGRSASARPCSRAPRPLPSVHPCFSITLRARSIPFGSPMSTRQLFDGHVAVGRSPTGGVAVCLRVPLHVCCHSYQQRTWSRCCICASVDSVIPPAVVSTHESGLSPCAECKVRLGLVKCCLFDATVLGRMLQPRSTPGPTLPRNAVDQLVVCGTRGRLKSMKNIQDFLFAAFFLWCGRAYA